MRAQEPGELPGQPLRSGVDQAERQCDLLVGAAERIRHLAPVRVARRERGVERAHQPDPPGRLGIRRHRAQRGEIMLVHRDHQVTGGEPGRLDLAGAVGGPVVAVPAELRPGRAVHPLPHVPVAGARALGRHRIRQARARQFLAQHHLGHG